MRKMKISDSVLQYDKIPYTNRKIKKSKCHENTTTNIDYTTIANSSGHPTGVVKPVCRRPTLPLTAKPVQSKGHTFKILNTSNPPYMDQGPTANQSGKVIKINSVHIFIVIRIVYQKDLVTSIKVAFFYP